MKSSIALWIVTVMATVACAPDPPPTAMPTGASPTAIQAASGTLVVTLSAIVGGFYAEGAFAYVEVSDLTGVEMASVEETEYGRAKQIARVELPAGRYVIGTYVRPCEAACPVLDGPTDGCELAVDIVAGETVEARVERRVGRTCMVSLAGTPRCAPVPVDAARPPGLGADQDIFVNDESHAIATGFLAGLAAIYADLETADVCRFFTGEGWTTALAFDPRLRAVDRGGSIIVQDHVLRIAFEGTYDLRDRPMIVPLDIVYDIPAGSTTTDLASGETETTMTDQRQGFHADFVFDGLRWRVDRLGPIGDEYREWTALPTIPPNRPPCTDFVRDPEGTAFDETADQPWCDENGRGESITRNQVVLLTRYPCDGGKAAILHIGRPLGTRLDRLVRWEYVRDPADEFFSQGWSTEPYDGAATLPDDATDTGWTNGNIDLWISPSENDGAVYVVRGESVERWPRTAESWGVIDCN
jgi:hypothetical protein